MNLDSSALIHCAHAHSFSKGRLPKMLSRRELATSLAMITAGTALASRAHAQKAFAEVPAGPWTETGLLQRAGGMLRYAKLGTANSNVPPAILLHKLGGWMADWRHVAPLLAKGRQVIAFDLPGHGGSRWEGPAPYIQTLGESAALLVGAFDEMGLTQVDLLGTSLGGCVGVVLAALFPARVHKLAIISSALGRARSLATIAELVDKGQTPAMFDAKGDPLPTDAKQLATTFGVVNIEPISAEGNSSRKQAGHWIQPSERGVAITDLVANLERVEADTLLLYGALDPTYVRFRVAAETALAHSRTAYVPGAGAFVIQDNPAASAAILNEFLEKG
jgi:pimeloyl-ACP methyl ester carboxylesterase